MSGEPGRNKERAKRFCRCCGHEARWHQLYGREKGGATAFLCIAGVGGQFEPMEFCECRESPKDAVPAPSRSPHEGA